MSEYIRKLSIKYNIPRDVENKIRNIFFIDDKSFEFSVKYYGDSPILWKYFENKGCQNDLLLLAVKYRHFSLVLRAIELGANENLLF